MANAFFTPFNNQPTSVTYHNAPVTLGADEYARLVVLAFGYLQDGNPAGDQGITIDGNLFYPQLEWNTNDFDDGNTVTIDCSGQLFVFSSSTNFEVRIRYGNSFKSWSGNNFGNAIDFSSTLISATSNNGDNAFVWVSAGSTIDYVGGAANQNTSCFLVPSCPLPTEIWLPPSTVISSGDGTLVRPYMLERYSTYS